MATVDKNFKVKHGLIVEGTTATVNGEDILTTGSTTDSLPQGSTNKYYSATQAKSDAADLLTGATLTNITITGDENGLTITAENGVADSTTTDLAEGMNLYFTDERAQDAIGLHVGTGLSYNDTTGAISVDTTTIATKTYVDGLASNYDAAGAASTAESNAKSYADSLASNYDPAGAASTAESNAVSSANSYTDTAVSNLVNGAPALLDTLNELASAINDDASFASTIATQIGNKQDALTAGNAIFIDGTTDTISVTYDAGLELDGNGKLVVDTDTIASKSYVDTNFVTTTSLSGQLSDYVPNTEKGSSNGVATLDGSGQVPLTQLGNVPSAYITSVGTNLDVTTGELTISASPSFTEVDINSVAKQVAAIASLTAATPQTAFAFAKASYRAAKFVVKVANSTDTEVSEILLTLDASDNIAITEYAIVGTNSSLSTISATVSGSNVNLVVTPVANGTVAVTGTLLA